MSASATVGKRVERSASQDALLRSLQHPGKRQEVENKAQPHPAVQHLLPALSGESKWVCSMFVQFMNAIETQGRL